MAAAEELESLYEKRLKVEAEKMKQLAGAKDDLQFKSEETVSKMKESHREDLRVRGSWSLSYWLDQGWGYIMFF